MRAYSIFVSVSRCQPSHVCNKLPADVHRLGNLLNEQRGDTLASATSTMSQQVSTSVSGVVAAFCRHFGMRCEECRGLGWVGVPSGFWLAAGDEGDFLRGEPQG